MLEKGQVLAPTTIATWFINRADRAAGEAITHLKVQKLVYYADAWYLANFDRPLVKEEFEAWAHGPVARAVFQKYRDNGYEALPPERARTVPAEVVSFLEAIHKEYGKFGAKTLERMTHKEDPWKVTRGDLPPEAKCDRPITKLLTRNYYAGRIGKKALKALPH